MNLKKLRLRLALGEFFEDVVMQKCQESITLALALSIILGTASMQVAADQPKAPTTKDLLLAKSWDCGITGGVQTYLPDGTWTVSSNRSSTVRTHTYVWDDAEQKLTVTYPEAKPKPLTLAYNLVFDDPDHLTFYRANSKSIEQQCASTARVEQMNRSSEIIRAQRQAEVRSFHQNNPGQVLIREGAIICESPRSFYKVGAIERSGNALIDLPYGCDKASKEFPSKKVQDVSDPVVGRLTVIGNDQNVGYVRAKDVQ